MNNKKDRKNFFHRFEGLTTAAIAKMTLKALSEYIYLSDGNEKLKSNDKVKFLIWNLPAVITCPGKTAQCFEKCYAKIAEMMYPGARNRRKKNLWISGSVFFVPMVIRWIELKAKHAKQKKIVVRVHESGDFYSKKYAEKWLTIMRHFEGDKKIVFEAYTKSLWMFEGVDLPKNFQLLYSVWPDTPTLELVRAKRMNVRIYTTFQEGDERFKQYFICPCDDCGHCLACINSKYSQIAAVIR